MPRRDQTTRDPIVWAAGAASPVIRVVDAPVQPSVFGYFDRAYVINRNCDTGRLAKTSARLQRIGVPFERFAAVEVRADERLFPDKPRLTPGYFACARSHLALLRLALQRGHERVIVLEDDAVFRDDTAERMGRAMPGLRSIAWDVFYFGLHLLEAGGPAAEGLGIVRRSFHSHAYAVSRKALPAMIEIIESAMRVGFHYDCHEMAGKPPLLRVYADPILAVQEPNESAVLGGPVDRLGQYFPPFDWGEFFGNCAEARGWEGRHGDGETRGRGDEEGAQGAGEGSGPGRSGVDMMKVNENAGPRRFPPLAASQISGSHQPDILAAAPSYVGSAPRTVISGSGETVRNADPTAAPPRSESPLRDAKRHHKAGRLAQAERLYRLALEHDSEDAEALHFYGLLEHQRGRTAAAVELLYKALAFRPDSAEYSGKLGMALAAAGRLEEALEALDRSIALDAGNEGRKNAETRGLGDAGNGGGSAAPFDSAFSIPHSAFPLAESHHNRGVVLDRLGRPDEAMAAWRRAIALRPGYGDALCLLGQKLLTGSASFSSSSTSDEEKNGPKPALQTLVEALTLLREAVRVDPRHAAAHNNLGIALRRSGDVAAAATHFRRAALLRPGHAEAHSNLGTALNELGSPGEAVPHLEKAAELRPDFVDAHWNLALSLLSLGEFDRGWLEYEWRRHLPADVPLHRPWPQPQWNGCNISGRTVLVTCEQGLGDTLQFIRYVPLLARRGASVVLECQPPLRELLEVCSAGFSPSLSSEESGNGLKPALRTQNVRVVAKGEPLPPFDVHVRIMSLPGILGTRLGNVPAEAPYLRADARRVEAWRKRLDVENAPSSGVPRPSPGAPGDGSPRAQPGSAPRFAGIGTTPLLVRSAGFGPSDSSGSGTDGLKPALRTTLRTFRIGIAWQGNPTFPNDRERSVPLVEFAPLAAVPGVRLFSLQKNHGVEQLTRMRAQLPVVSGQLPLNTPMEDRADSTFSIHTSPFPVVDFSPPLDEGCGAFVDTAAVMANLDLVISSDTSMVHLAGALGVPVWMATSYACDWRWLRDRDDSPWYPTLRLFRQPRRGDWAAVFERMAAALRDTLASEDGHRHEHAPAAVPMAPGDLIDRLTILQIKSERLSDPTKLRGIRAELDALRAARQRSLPESEQLQTLARELRAVNEELWAIEDDIRLCERSGDFGPKFVELARSVYRTNDRRADLKRQVNGMLGSALGDEKQYAAYG